MEDAALLGEEVVAGLPGQIFHVGERSFEAAAVGDPLAVERGVVGRQQPGDRLTGLLPGQLPVGAVALVGRGSNTRVLQHLDQQQPTLAVAH